MNNIRSIETWALVTACIVLSACQDSPTSPAAIDSTAAAETEPAARTAASAPSVGAAPAEALRDALTRVHPSLARDERSAAVGSGLQQAITAIERGETMNANRALQALERALERYTERNDAQSPDVEVIRLAVRSASKTVSR